MNRSFRAPEKVMPGPPALKQRQPQTMGSFRKSVKEKEEELGLFLEMRKREKDRNNLLRNSDEFDSSLGSIESCSPMFGVPATTPARKTGADEFLNSENDKNDYDWLLTPPGTPLFPSLELESQKTSVRQIETPKARPTALKSRLSNTHLEATGRNKPLSSPGLNGPRRPTSSGGPGSRPATPTGRPATPTGRPATPTGRPTLGRPVSNTLPKTTSRPTRSSTPTPRSSTTMGPTKPTLPARSSTPTPRSSTPTRGPTPRAPTPTRRLPPQNVAAPPPRRAAPPQSRVVPPPRASSPTVKRPWKPQEMPGYTLDTPPNLRTSLSDRPTSATRGRPVAVNRSTSVEPAVNGRVRRQSCSPSRGRLPTGVSHHHMSGSSVPVPALNRAYAKANDNRSPGSYGTKMVERVVNMRKLVPPKHDDRHSPHSNLSAKSSSPDSAGFGRSFSKKSLDMAIRHMDIRRTVPGNLRPLMSNIPASSMYSVRAGPTRSRTMSVSDSPLATSSNASSDMSVNNNGVWLDGNIDDEINSLVRSPANIRGR